MEQIESLEWDFKVHKNKIRKPQNSKHQRHKQTKVPLNEKKKGDINIKL